MPDPTTLDDAIAGHYAGADRIAADRRQAALAAAFVPDPAIEEQLASAAKDADYAAEMDRAHGAGADRLSLSAYLDARRAAIALGLFTPKENPS